MIARRQRRALLWLQRQMEFRSVVSTISTCRRGQHGTPFLLSCFQKKKNCKIKAKLRPQQNHNTHTNRGDGSGNQSTPLQPAFRVCPSASAGPSPPRKLSIGSECYIYKNPLYCFIGSSIQLTTNRVRRRGLRGCQLRLLEAKIPRKAKFATTVDDKQPPCTLRVFSLIC